MLFITNRIPTGGIVTEVGRDFEFDLENNAPGNSVFYCEREAKGRYREIGGMNLMSRLKDSSYRQILIYIHGFSNLPEDAFARAEELQRLADRSKSKEVLVLPMVWPCDADFGVVKDYWDDQSAADASASSFGRVLEIFMKWRASPEFNPEDTPCLKRVNILAHSMGNRVLRESLKWWTDRCLSDGPPLLFRNTFMVAADVVNECLEPGQRGEPICHASRNVIAYYASDDLALRASKAANLRNRIASRRLGHTGPEHMERVPQNVFAVDCDEINTAYDPPKGHSYFGSGRRRGTAGVVFRHMMESIVSGRPVQLGDRERRLFLDDPPPKRTRRKR